MNHVSASDRVVVFDGLDHDTRLKLDCVCSRRKVSQLVDRVNSRSPPFLSSFGKFAWFGSVDRTSKIRGRKRAKCIEGVFRTTLKVHFQRGIRALPGATYVALNHVQLLSINLSYKNLH